MDTVDEIYSRKVFIGGLPFDTTEENIRGKFEPYGGMEIDWPKRSGTASMSVQSILNFN
jgi:cytoplasmic polyadenylation element-binding protein